MTKAASSGSPMCCDHTAGATIQMTGIYAKEVTDPLLSSVEWLSALTNRPPASQITFSYGRIEISRQQAWLKRNEGNCSLLVCVFKTSVHGMVRGRNFSCNFGVGAQHNSLP